jgi:hypothetical protein
MGQLPLRHPPRHLAQPRRSRTGARDHVVAEWLLAGVAVVLTAAVVVGSLFDRPRSEHALPAIEPPAAVGTTVAAPTSTVAAKQAARSSNLLVDPGFEGGLAGWRPIGGAGLERAGSGRQGRWTARLVPTRPADQGMALGEVLRCKPNKSYAAAVWVRASQPGVLVQLNLLESVRGKRLAIDTVGAVLGNRDWQRLEVAHLVHRPGAALGLEVVLPRGSRRTTILVDDLEVVAHTASFMDHG